MPLSEVKDEVFSKGYIGKETAIEPTKGDRVTVGQKLLNFDLEEIKKEGYSIITPVVVTNSAQYKDVVTVSDNGKNLLSVLV